MNNLVKSINELVPQMIMAEYFEVEFIKKDSTTRSMICEFESTQYIDKSIITVVDLEIDEYRTVNLKTINKIIIDGCVYKKLSNGQIIFDGYTKEYILDEMAGLGIEVDIIEHWSINELLCLYNEIIDLNDELLTSVKAVLEFVDVENMININIIMDVISKKLEFIPNRSMEEVLEQELYGIHIPIGYINISYYDDFKPSLADIQEYYFESSYGVLQIKAEMR
ncbi:hypothetical protein KJ870_00640 [bacterium]|nr:hypothetical protein [bacterium]MBU1433437.1 hypothetical protein [bacterium]MBU1503381.1 hypothetical protein [bacterium]